jgi:hypothetical protein
MAQTKNWAKGLVIDQYGGSFGSYQRLGIKRDEFVDWLMGLEDNNGWVDLYSMPRKGHESRWNVAESSRGDRTQGVPQQSNPKVASDSLPF